MGTILTNANASVHTSTCEEAELESINSENSYAQKTPPSNILTEEEKKTLKAFLYSNNTEEIVNFKCEREYATVHSKYDNDDTLLHLASNFLDIAEETMREVTTLFAGHDLLHEINSEKMEPLHVASACANTVAVKILLDFIKPENRNRCWTEAKTPYIVMIKDPNYEQYFEDHPTPEDYTLPEHKRRVDCLNVMLDYDLDINKVDFADKTPIFWAASYGYKHLVEAILNQKKQPVDLDNVMSGKSPRKIILAKKLYSDPLPEPYEYTMSTLDLLFKHLRHRNIEPFVKVLKLLDKKQTLDIVNGDNQSYTLLQFACVKNIHQIVDRMLRIGADPNLTIPQNRKSPLEIAINWGNSDIVQLLLEQPRLEIPKLLLHNVLEYAHKFDSETLQDKLKCVKMILKSNKYDGMHEFDEDGFIPLNYTALVPEMAALLLAHGASLSCRNAHNVLAIIYMDSETLKAHFNDCVKEEVGYDKEEMYIKNYVAKFDFRSLLPPKKNEKLVQFEESIEEIDESEFEANVNVRRRIRSRETDVVLYMSRNPNFRHLLKHPTVKAFLIMKWHLMRWFFYGNMLLYSFYCVSQFFYVFNTCLEIGDENTFWRYLLMVSVATLTTREVIEMLLLKKYYIFPREAIEQITITDLNYENICELIVHLMTYFLLFCDVAPEIRKPFSIVVILSTAIGLVLNLERMPMVNTKMAMLKRVTENIFKTFLIYSIIIIPFALSFSILYKHTEIHATNSTTASEPQVFEQGFLEDPDDPQFFNNFYLSVFKTVIMMTGEYEMKDSIDFEKYPIVSSILFVLFVFFVAIIVFNLLTGLAVSDTQAIVNEAELLGLISRTQHICYIESLLFKFKVKKKFLIAHRYPEIKVYPNKYAEVIFPPKENVHDPKENVKAATNKFTIFAKFCMFFGINLWVLRLGEKIANDTLNIIEERNAKQRKKFKKRVNELENENMGLKKRIKELKTEIRLIKENNRNNKS